MDREISLHILLSHLLHYFHFKSFLYILEEYLFLYPIYLSFFFTNFSLWHDSIDYKLEDKN